MSIPRGRVAHFKHGVNKVMTSNEEVDETTEVAKKEEEKAEAEGTRELTFRCGFCGKSKPLSEMRVLTTFFPPLIACQDCEKQMQ